MSQEPHKVQEGTNTRHSPTDHLVHHGTDKEIKSASRTRVRSIDPGAIGLFEPTARKNWSWDRSKFLAEVRRQAPKKPRKERVGPNATTAAQAEMAAALVNAELENLLALVAAAGITLETPVEATK